ncbi:hypothetical protein [Cuneatibacter sp. NSJ-177]|nr:hypothetical protein [Cuneatibacter sp. NSJ-177]
MADKFFCSAFFAESEEPAVAIRGALLRMAGKQIPRGFTGV